MQREPGASLAVVRVRSLQKTALSLSSACPTPYGNVKGQGKWARLECNFIREILGLVGEQ